MPLAFAYRSATLTSLGSGPVAPSIIGAPVSASRLRTSFPLPLSPRPVIPSVPLSLGRALDSGSPSGVYFLRLRFSFAFVTPCVGASLPSSILPKIFSDVLNPMPLRTFFKASKNLPNLNKILPIIPAGGFLGLKCLNASATASSWM